MRVENFMTYINFLRICLHTVYVRVVNLQFLIANGEFEIRKIFKYLLTNSFFFTGQLSSFEMYAISFSLSLFSLLH